MRYHARLFVILFSCLLLCAAPVGGQPYESWPRRLWLTTRYSFFWFAESMSVARGLWEMFALEPCRVTFLGSSRVGPSHDLSRRAHELAQLCAEHNIAVVTGVSTGIMAAAARGVLDQTMNPIGKNLGINTMNLGAAHEQQPTVVVENFEIRQWLLLNFSTVLVFFPGGVGTLYEFTQMLTLVDTRHMQKIPVILIDRAYWARVIALLRSIAGLGLLDERLLEGLTIVDAPQEAFEIIQRACAVRTSEFNIIDY